MSGVTLALTFPPSSAALRFMQQYPREQVELVAHCALLYGVRCLGVHASTSGALSLEQLKRLSGYADTTPLTADGSGIDMVEADFARLTAAQAPEATTAESTSKPAASGSTRVAASTAIRGAADAWNAEASAVDRGLRRRRIQPPPRPRAPRETESDSDGGSNAALENQLHALEAELADLKDSAGGTWQDKEHSAAVDKLLQLSATVGVDADAWQAEPPSDRDSVKVVRSGLDLSVPLSSSSLSFLCQCICPTRNVVTCWQSVNIPATRRKHRQQAKVERNQGRGRRDGKSSTKSEVAGSKCNVKNRRGKSRIQEHAPRAAQSYGRGRSVSISAVTARIIADRERARYQQQQVCPPTLV